MTSTIVTARWIVTGIQDRRTPQILEHGAVLSRAGRIEAVGTLEEMLRLAPQAAVKHYTNHVMLPGFVNSHHHVGVTPVQSGSPDYPLELWIGYRLFERRIDLFLDTLYSAFELIASGVTTVAHLNGFTGGNSDTVHANSTKILEAYRTIGMRVSFAPMARDQNRLVYEADETFCARLPPELGRELAQHLRQQTMPIADSLALFDQLTRDCEGNRLTRIQLAPANLHWCSDDALLALAEKSQDAKVPMHIHLLETAFQKEYARRRTGGRTAVRHLADLGVLGPSLTLGHGVWLTDEDIDIAADTGTCICHNCSSNLRLRSGVAPLNAYEAKGVTTAIGIDEAGLNDDRDMLQEMRLVLRMHRTPGLEEDEVPTVPQVVRMATEGGAKTTAFGVEIGRLEPSRFFDAVLIDWNEVIFPFQHEEIPLLDVVIQRAKASAVKGVYIDGELVYENGRFTRVDRDAVMREIAEHLSTPPSESDKVRRSLAHRVLPHVKQFYKTYLPEMPRSRPFYNVSARDAQD